MTAKGDAMKKPNAWVVCCVGALASVAGAQPVITGPDANGFTWCEVGDAGNAPYQTDNPSSRTNGRGSVAYEYRISRTEVTSQQWMEFINTYSGEFGDPYLFRLVSGGFMPDSSYSGPGSRWTLIAPSLANAPVFGITWRQAAMYMNWLHNDKQPTLAALQTGAYDASTFGQSTNGSITDAPTHQPGARFWIPTHDEWVKAAHYDPHRYGVGQGGYWQSVNSTDEPLIAGLPGVGQTSAGLEINDPLLGERDIPLGAYADQMSPWGLTDLSGGGREWTEGLLYAEGPYARIVDGNAAGYLSPFGSNKDLVDYIGGDAPWIGVSTSFRVASSVPAPGALLMLAAASGVAGARRRRP